MDQSNSRSNTRPNTRSNTRSYTRPYPHSTTRRLRPPLLMLAMVAGFCIAACYSGQQTVTLTAQDNQFHPTSMRLSAERPLHLTVYNAGREQHEFASPLLAYARRLPDAGGPPEEQAEDPVPLRPGQTVRLLIVAPPGTYLYWCTRKGHPNMSGTLLIE